MKCCPNCGKPTAIDYAERHDPRFCSPITSPNCWELRGKSDSRRWTKRGKR